LRVITEVIDQLEKVIPSEHHKKLEKVRDDSYYKAPELAHEMWDKLSEVVSIIIDTKNGEDFVPEWKVMAVSILMEIPKDEACIEIAKRKE
jgi:hypothetical protein